MMKNFLRNPILVISILICQCSLLVGQEITITRNGVKEEIYFDRSKACDKELVFTIVGQMPEYKGGIEQLELDLNEAISFDKKVKEGIVLKATVNCHGEIFGILEPGIVTSPYSEKLQKEIMQLQIWEAGIHRGKRRERRNICRTVTIH